MLRHRRSAAQRLTLCEDKENSMESLFAQILDNQKAIMSKLQTA